MTFAWNKMRHFLEITDDIYLEPAGTLTQLHYYKKRHLTRIVWKQRSHFALDQRRHCTFELYTKDENID